ncbi:MAG: hypothetical protein M0P59_01300 [Gallionella sp.]|jgi:hypothetical protein|nr:hypothetical protein [Gallionella sp.]MCK9352778.1 hypothetical protein [Gallionella sp.]
MAVKQQPALTKEDFEAALVSQRLSISEVARETGIPRHIVSHFRNYGDGMKPEQLAKLRDYLEGLGVEFADEEEPEATTAQPATPQELRLPLILSDDGLTQRTALVCRHFFIDERINDEQIEEAGKCIMESFQQAKELLDVRLETRFLSEAYDEKTETKMRKLWGHLASIGLLCLHMQGRVLVDQARFANPVQDDEPNTLGDLLFVTYREALAGLHQAEAEEAEEAAA